MEDFLSIMGLIYDGLNQPFTIYGFTFSLWNVFMLVAVCGLVVTFIKMILDI